MVAPQRTCTAIAVRRRCLPPLAVCLGVRRDRATVRGFPHPKDSSAVRIPPLSIIRPSSGRARGIHGHEPDLVTVDRARQGDRHPGLSRVGSLLVDVGCRRAQDRLSGRAWGHQGNDATAAPLRSTGHRADHPCVRVDHRRPSPHRAWLKRRAGPCRWSAETPRRWQHWPGRGQIPSGERVNYPDLLKPAPHGALSVSWSRPLGVASLNGALFWTV